jgi:hypothetical protein
MLTPPDLPGTPQDEQVLTTDRLDPPPRQQVARRHRELARGAGGGGRPNRGASGELVGQPASSGERLHDPVPPALFAVRCVCVLGLVGVDLSGVDLGTASGIERVRAILATCKSPGRTRADRFDVAERGSSLCGT